MTNLGRKCATFDCDGKIIKINNHIAKCNECEREYWIRKYPGEKMELEEESLKEKQ